MSSYCHSLDHGMSHAPLILPHVEVAADLQQRHAKRFYSPSKPPIRWLFLCLTFPIDSFSRFSSTAQKHSVARSAGKVRDCWRRQKAHVRVKARRARLTAMDGGNAENAGAIYRPGARRSCTPSPPPRLFVYEESQSCSSVLIQYIESTGLFPKPSIAF